MYQFQFRWIPFIATCALMAIFLRLGWWQLTKAIDLEAQLELRDARNAEHPILLGSELVNPKEVEGSIVWARGHFDANNQFLLDNQQYKDKPGLHVITPLQIEGSQVRVLVNRGWVGWGHSREVLPEVKVPSGLVELHGRAMSPSSKAPAYVSETLGETGALRTRIRLDEIQASQNYPIQPIVILMDESEASDGLVREWPELSNKAPMHKGYAVQWLMLAVLLFFFFLYSSLRKVNDVTL